MMRIRAKGPPGFYRSTATTVTPGRDAVRSIPFDRIGAPAPCPRGRCAVVPSVTVASQICYPALTVFAAPCKAVGNLPTEHLFHRGQSDELLRLKTMSVVQRYGGNRSRWETSGHEPTKFLCPPD